MASFAQTLRTYRSGNLTLDELLQEVDRLLTHGRANAKWMLATLAEEDHRQLLPADVHEAVKQKIEAAAQAEQPEENHPTGTQYAQGDGTPDMERTVLTRRYSAESSVALAPSTGVNSTLEQGEEAYRIKGTGDVLNHRFELEECVGSGGMGKVYKALDRRKLEANDRNPHVAVKILNLAFRAHPDSLIALQREAKKCQSLAHPNILRVYDFDRDGATVYMTMEYLSGESLGRKTGAPDFKGMTSHEALRIVNFMGRALAFAHECGIVHSDFKPANVFIIDTGEVKVIDFGLARAFQRAEDADMEATRFDAGSLGALTPAYASPEMLERKQPDPRDDIYSLACTTYEMLTGHHPFGKTHATAARDGGLHLKRHKALTRCQWRALHKALAFDREKRTATVNQFLREINAKHSLANRIALGAAAVGSVVLIGAGIAYNFSDIRRGAPPAVDQAAAPELAPSMIEPKPPTQAARVERPARRAETPEISLGSVLPLIQRISCSLIQASVDGGVVSLEGYAKERDITRLKGDLGALAGVSRVDVEITPISDEKCDIIEVVSPFWFGNRKLELGTSIRPKNETGQFVEGESLILDIRTPSYDSYVNVDYYSLDGGVVHMVPSPRLTSNQAPANYQATIGDLGEWTVVEPFGTEMIVLLATPEPLFDSLRKEYEPTSQYLADLKKRLTQLIEKVGKNRITADFVLITTRKGT